MPKKGSKMKKKIKKHLLICFNKYQSLTHVYTCISQGLFTNIVFRSVALVINKLWAILDFFTDRTLFRPVLYNKNSLNYYSFKFHGVSVKNESPGTKKNTEGVGAKR